MANPFMSVTAATDNVANNLDEIREYAYDFEKMEFIYDEEGNHVIVTRNEALKIWITKALLTERYRYRAYFDDYGLEIEHFIGTVTNDGLARNELYRYVEEGLLVNPYINNVLAVELTQEKKSVQLTVAVTTVYGELTVGLEV